MKNLYKIILIIIISLASCDDNSTIKNFEPQKTKVGFTSLSKEDKLRQAIDKIGLLNNQSSGRIKSEFSYFNTDSIIKVIQSDSINYTFTFSLKNAIDKNTFKNLVFRRVSNGFLGFIMEYHPIGLYIGMESFSGAVKRYDLEGNLVYEYYMTNGVNASKGNVGGRLAVECDEVITITREHPNGGICNDEIGLTAYDNCITILTIGDCGPAEGGSTQNNNDFSYLGTFIYDPSYTSGSGTSNNSGSGTGLEEGDLPVDEIESIGVYQLSYEDLMTLWANAIESMTDPEQKRKAQLGYISTHDGQDGRDFASMIDEIIITNGITVGDVLDINLAVNNYYLNLRGRYIMAVYYPFAKAAQFIVELALIETGTTVFFNSIKIVLSTRYGITASRLAATVAKTTEQVINAIKAELRFGVNNASLELTIGARSLVGTANGSKTAYTFTGVSQAEAKSLFDKLSSGVKQTKIQVPNKGEILRADLGSNQFIQYRTWSTTNQGEITIEFIINDFKNSKIELKFFN